MKITKSLIAAMFIMMMTGCKSDKKDYDATGTFEVTEVTVSAEASGELKSFGVTEGQQVSDGVTLGEIDSKQLVLKRDELAANQSQLNATNSQIEANKRQLEATRSATVSKQLDLKKQVASIHQQISNLFREKQRFTELLRDGAASQKQVDDISYQIEVLQKQLAATEEQISSQNASLSDQDKGIIAQIEGLRSQQNGISAQHKGVEIRRAQFDDQIAHTVIRSPISGTILEKYVEAGEFVATGKPLFKVADMRHMVLRCYVTSAQLTKVRVGKKVQVRLDYGGGVGQEYTGTITWISTKSEFTPKTILTEDERADLVYAVKISVLNDGNIKIGMYGQVKL